MDFITGLPLCANDCNAIFACVDRLTKYTVLTAYTLGAGELSTKQVAQVFFQGVVRQFGLSDNVVHDRDPLQSSGLNSATPLDPMLSLAVLTTPKQIGKQKDNTEH